MLLVVSACQKGGADEMPAGALFKVLSPFDFRFRADGGKESGKVRRPPERATLFFPVRGLASGKTPSQAPPPWTNSRRSFVCKMR